MSTDVWDQLALRLGEGDPTIVARLVVDYELPLRQLARRYLTPYLRTQLDTGDVVQSAWVQVLRSVAQAKWHFPDQRAFRAFLLKVLRNRLADHARRIQAGQERELRVATAESHQPSRLPRPSEFAQAAELWEQMQRLCPAQHLPILDMKRQGLPLDEIASRMELHPGSVRRILYDLARRLALQGTSSGKAEGDDA